MALSIIVKPAGDRWTLQSDELGLHEVFDSGRRAEFEGRALARRLARDGEPVDLQIILRDGTIAAVISFGSAAAA